MAKSVREKSGDCGADKGHKFQGSGKEGGISEIKQTNKQTTLQYG